MQDFVIELHVSLEEPQAAIMAALAAGMRMKSNGGTVRRYTVKEAAGKIIEDVPFPADPRLAIDRAIEMLK